MQHILHIAKYNMFSVELSISNIFRRRFSIVCLVIGPTVQCHRGIYCVSFRFHCKWCNFLCRSVIATLLCLLQQSFSVLNRHVNCYFVTRSTGQSQRISGGWMGVRFFLSCPSWVQGRNEVRWSPGQEASLAPPWSNLRSLGSKCTEGSTCDIVEIFRRPRIDSAPP